FESRLVILRRLVGQRPGDERLRERLRAVEDRLFGATVEIETPTVSRGSESSQATSVADAAEQAVDESSEPPSDSVAAYVETPKEGPVGDFEPAAASSSAVLAAPSIREFLVGILARRTATPVAPAPEAEAADASDRPECAPESIRDVPVSPVVSMDAVDVE